MCPGMDLGAEVKAIPHSMHAHTRVVGLCNLPVPSAWPALCCREAPGDARPQEVLSPLEAADWMGEPRRAGRHAG